MQETIDWITNNWDSIVMVLLALYAIAHQIAKWTPNKKDDEIIGKLQKFFDVLGKK